MYLRHALPAVTVAALLATASLTQAAVVINVTETGGDVVFSASGAIDLSSVSMVDINVFTPFVAPNHGVSAAFLIGDNSLVDVDLYEGGIIGPGPIGTGPAVGPQVGSGDMFGVLTDGSTTNTLVVPSNYLSNAPLNATMSFSGATIASLGLTPGTYQWALTGGGVLMTLNIGAAPVPEPGTLALWAAGVGLLAAVGARRGVRQAA